MSAEPEEFQAATLPGEQVSCTQSQWEMASAPDREVTALAEVLRCPLFVARVLWARGVRNQAAAGTFLQPRLEDLHDPSLLCGMSTAVARVVRAVEAREPILIYGDYDVDGTLATVLLKTAIDRVTPKGEASLVRYHIPHRIREGYGVQAAVLADAATAGVRLVISVDTGIRAFAAADEAKALGLDLIVTDHHLPEEIGVPDAVAVINPNQRGCGYPEKNLCGAAVAYKLAEALLRAAAPGLHRLHAVEPASLRRLQCSLLKLAAIATVADAVPLLGENRAIVALGLGELRQVHQPGLRTLMRLAQVGGAGVAPSATEVAFRIGPRINAAGRMDVASDVVRLLLTRDVSEAEALAGKLHALNDERRSVEATVLLEIEAQLTAMLESDDAEESDCYVLDGQGWHRGVIGILASRVVERKNRPALVIARDEQGAAHGSGRSVAGFHLLDAITALHLEHREAHGSELFHRFGGHAHAIGFSLPTANVPLLRASLLRYARAFRATLGRPRTLLAGAELPLEEAVLGNWEWLQRLQPFGNGNPEPVFLSRGVVVAELRVIKERHLRLRVFTCATTEATLVCWARNFSWPERLAELGIAAGTPVDVLYQMRWNQHPDFGGLELQVCDLRVSVA